MPRIFVNYRTGDAGDVAALVERELSGRLGADVLFRASKSIPLGDDYTRALLRAVRESDVVLAFVGPHWLDAGDDGERKIDREDDWTRQELLEAFRHDVRVIPVLVGDVPRLRQRDLPSDLAQLALCQYARLGHRNQEADLDLLTTQLRKLVPALREPSGNEREEATPAPERGGFVNHAGRDVNIGVQARDIRGGVRFGDVGPRGTGPAPGDGRER